MGRPRPHPAQLGSRDTKEPADASTAPAGADVAAPEASAAPAEAPAVAGASLEVQYASPGNKKESAPSR